MEQDLRDLMGIPDNYKVLFIQGGGTVQFAMIPPLVALAYDRREEKRAFKYIKTGLLCCYVVFSIITLVNWCAVA